LDRSIAGLRAFGTATVYEAAGGRGLLEVDLIRLIPGSRAAGPARTVLCRDRDNLGVHEALETLRPGEVLVISTPNPQPVALVGELLATQAHLRGAEAILVDGAVRDADEIVELGLPVWCRWIRATKADKEHHGELGASVTIGESAITDGDIVILDGDGAVVVPKGDVEATLEASAQRQSDETRIREQLLRGELTLDLLNLRKPKA
jgi:4-hydroxy-4-methyl-2-oxoglutarate aldolase